MKARKLPIRKCYVCNQKKPISGYVIWDKYRPEVGTGKRKWYLCSDCENTQDKVV